MEKQEERFNVAEWLKQGERARAELHRRERAAIAAVAEAQKELDEVREEMKKVDAILGVAPDGGSERRSGVLDLTRKTVAELPDKGHPGREVGWSEGLIVENVLEADPLMKAKSIQGALRRMVKDGELERIGKRGTYRYRRPKAVPSQHADTASPKERIHSALVSAGKSGAGIKDLAWVLGDEESTMIILDEMIAAKTVETFPVGEGAFHYRLREDSEVAPAPATTQKTLFGAEPPAE